MNQSVSFELAKLLKEKGFNEEVRDYYSEQDGTFFYSQYFRDNISINEKQKGFVTAPTIADVVMWLYKNHYIWVNVNRDWDYGKHLGFKAIIDISVGLINTETFETPSEAYEAAMFYTLTNLI